MTTHLFLLDEDEREVIDEGDLEEGKKKSMNHPIVFQDGITSMKGTN